MKKILISISFLLLSLYSFTQRQDLQKISGRKMKSLDSTGWEKTGFFIFNINQAALSEMQPRVVLAASQIRYTNN